MGAETDYTTNRVKTVSVAVNTATVSEGRTPAAAAGITETPSRQEHFNWWKMSQAKQQFFFLKTMEWNVNVAFWRKKIRSRLQHRQRAYVTRSVFQCIFLPCCTSARERPTTRAHVSTLKLTCRNKLFITSYQLFRTYLIYVKYL